MLRVNCFYLYPNVNGLLKSKHVKRAFLKAKLCSSGLLSVVTSSELNVSFWSAGLQPELQQCCCGGSPLLTILPPWVPSRSSSESSTQQRVRRGRGSGKGWFTQGSSLPHLVPLASFSWQFPPSTWPASTPNPSLSLRVFGCIALVTLLQVFFDHGCRILRALAAVCLSWNLYSHMA